jgi:hypothetical protein
MEKTRELKSLVKDTLAIEALIDSIGEYLEAKTEQDKSRAAAIEAGAYSWEYFARRLIEDTEKAAQEVKERFSLAVRAEAITLLQEVFARRPIHSMSDLEDAVWGLKAKRE